MFVISKWHFNAPSSSDPCRIADPQLAARDPPIRLMVDSLQPKYSEWRVAAGGLKKAAAKQPNITRRITERWGQIHDPKSRPCKTLGEAIECVGIAKA